MYSGFLGFHTHKKIRDQNQFLYDATLTGINLNKADPNITCNTYSTSKQPCDSHQYHTTLLAHKGPQPILLETFHHVQHSRAGIKKPQNCRLQILGQLGKHNKTADRDFPFHTRLHLISLTCRLHRTRHFTGHFF